MCLFYVIFHVFFGSTHGACWSGKHQKKGDGHQSIFKRNCMVLYAVAHLKDYHGLPLWDGCVR
jgi:hypothetical protein